MGSEIIFLGTGGDAVVVGKQQRASGGIILRSGGQQFHIDPGPGALVRAMQWNVNLRENTAVLASHVHTNHCNDVNAVIDAMTYGGMDKYGVLIASSSVVNGDEQIKPALSDWHSKCVEKVIVLSSGLRAAIEDIEIEALPAAHSDNSAIGFKLSTPDFVLSYSGDTAYSKSIAKAYRDSDILILNVVAPFGEKVENLLNSDDAVKIINEVNPRLAIITHFGSKMLKADPLCEAREIQKKSGCQVIAAADGMVLNPSSYAVRSAQKRLRDMGLEQKSDKITNDTADA